MVVAAGGGTRLGQPLPKAFVPVGGRSILEWALDSVFGMHSAAQVIVVVPAALLDEAETLCQGVAGAAQPYLSVVSGGATRQQSVAAGIACLDSAITVVLVHDAARAFTPSTQFDRVASAVERSRAGVVPAIAVSDTIKHADAAGRVTRTLDRSELFAVQTPQGFPRKSLTSAYAAATEEYTDDAALFAAAGHQVTVVDGDVDAFKITTPWDLRRAEQLQAGSIQPGPVSRPRTGIGIDVHPFDESKPLWLGGIYWPDEPGLAGHSDGDAMSHAVCDALLSAAGLGDLGARFGTSDPRFADAHGAAFIGATVSLVTGAGYDIGNVAVQVVANHPKIASRRVDIEEHLTGLVGAPVSVAATTSDGLGFTGRGDGVAVVATALVWRSR